MVVPNWDIPIIPQSTETCPALTGGAFPALPAMSHTLTLAPRERHLGGEQRRALRLLACNPFGATEAIMHVHGFRRPMLAKLVRAGLVTVQSETGKAIAVGRIRITDAGRRWLEDAAKSELRGPNRF
jgi:hypothetical protein